MRLASQLIIHSIVNYPVDNAAEVLNQLGPVV